ncbi:MAG: acyl carrier protein [Rhodanobacteraceae bacterium]
MESIESRVRTFIRETFPVSAADGDVPINESLLDSGIIDSIGVLSLVTWLEQEFDIVVADEDVVPEHLDSIERIVNFVRRKSA